MRIFVTGMGIVSPIGIGVDAFRASLTSAAGAVGPLSLFAESAPLPVGQIRDPINGGPLPLEDQGGILALGFGAHLSAVEVIP